MTKSILKIALTICCYTILGSWTMEQSGDISKAMWLTGTWENKTTKGSIFETWIVKNEHELSGKSYIVKEKDTIVFERISLVQEQGDLLYIPTVKNQNNGAPIRFLCKKISEQQMIFENTEHDFPQVISYTKITEDSLVAEISGTKNEQFRKQSFNMKRLP